MHVLRRVQDRLEDLESGKAAEKDAAKAAEKKPASKNWLTRVIAKGKELDDGKST